MATARRKDKVERDRRLLAKRREGFLAVVRKLGVEREFGRLPVGTRNELYVVRVKPAEVLFDSTVRPGESAEGLKREVEAVLDKPLVDFAGNGQEISFNEAWWVGFTLFAMLGPTCRLPGVAAEVGRSMGRICTNEAFGLFEELGRQAVRWAWMRAMKYSRLDERIYSVGIRNRTDADPYADGKEFVISVVEPRRRSFVVDGRERVAYRLGVPQAGGGVEWFEWDGAKVGMGAGAKVPVYVQPHVMQRLMERMPGDRCEEKRGTMHMLMCGALIDGEVVQCDRGTYWIALWDFGRQRLGYLLAEVVDGALLVRTYQFLTMEGSPEARRLYTRLGARRGDFEHLELDKLATFVGTDLEKDEELKGIFAECGCGHLFDLRKSWEWEENAADGTAEWVRKYLELGPGTKKAA